jgi:ATP-binding cassette subfamily B protein/subfamily B ATP-binding cassette protein MsbA
MDQGPPPGHSSRSRFARYLAQRRTAHRDERVHEHVDRELEKSRAQKAKRSFNALLARLWSILAGHRAQIALSLITLSAAVALGLVLPLATKVSIDYAMTDAPGPEGLPDWARALVGTDRHRLLGALAAFMLALTLASTALGLWGRWQCTRITKRVQMNLRRRVFDHASRLPLHRIHALKSGGVSSILREDTGGVGDLVFTLIYNPWRAITQLLGTFAVLAWIDWRLLAGALLLVPLVWLSHRTWIARLRPLYRDIRQTRQGIDAHSAEAFSGMRVVRAFNRRQAEAARFTTAGHFMARQELHTWWWARIVEMGWQIMIPAASAALLVYGGGRVVRGEITVGDLMAFTAYLLMLLGPLESLVGSATYVQTNLAALDRVMDLLDEAPEFASQARRDPIDPARVRGRITFENVSFAYPSRDKASLPRLVLENITLDVAPGETIALVGPSGAGKTTLCNLVARFHDPTTGRVLIDSTDLTTIDPESYRRLLGVVEQDVFLFDGTVADNIAYARRHATREQIAAAAHAANAHGFITELERGYDTLIGERGVRLSGGQKQRLAIARALLADPRILILDEATSSLDTESERLIQRSLAGLMRGRTCFVIAHRLSTIRNASRIVVLDAGQIAEIGTHDELLASGGRYATVLRMQLEGDVEAEAGLR